MSTVYAAAMVEFAVVEVPTTDLSADTTLLEAIGFQLELVFPADAPRVAVLTGLGLRLRLDVESTAAPPTIQLDGANEAIELSAGVKVQPATPKPLTSDFADRFVHAVGGEWAVGRAGMHYRDLIPSRHGGRVIASHIRIVEPGPVPDYVHHHDVRFQMIYCRRGRVEVVYEDQGESFWMVEGDCVLQPPNIRHRVLASDGGLEVVEIASPAEHPTHIDNQIKLPTADVNPERDFDGQRFSFDRATDGVWTAAEPGWEHRETAIEVATSGLASVRVVRPTETGTALTGSHDGDLCLFFILTGEAELEFGEQTHTVAPDDSIALPRHHEWTLTSTTSDFAALQVSVSAEEETP